MVTTEAGAIYRSFEQPDLGVDGSIELLTQEREPSGDIVLVQIKSGASFIQGGRFYLRTDAAHFETWARYAVPIVGIVHDPRSRQARWVDVSAHLQEHPEAVSDGPYQIEAPRSQAFSVEAFSHFVARFRRTRTSATRVDAIPNLLIREWKQEDLLPTRALLEPIAIDYPGFDKWLNAKLRDPETSKKVVVQSNTIAAFSMWKQKDARNIKLQTFIVGAPFRGTALGQHLLYHELRTWARLERVERVHVTVSSSKADLIQYFRTFGFRVEGFAPNRYERANPDAELIMAKHLIRRVVRTPSELEELADYLTRRIWGLRPAFAGRFEVTSAYFGIPARLPAVSVEIDSSTTTVETRLSVVDGDAARLVRHDDASLMEDFHPLRIHLPDKRFVIVPIFKKWVDQMLSPSGPDTPLKLRVDNAYYCHPNPRDVRRGDLVIFYEPKKEGGRGAAIGAALALEVRLDEPKALHAHFSRTGVYSLANVRRHVGRRGDAMAIRFGLFEPFPQPVTLDRIREILGKRTNVQGLTPIPRDAFEAIRSEGLEQS